jgi:hypothetical protein
LTVRRTRDEKKTKWNVYVQQKLLFLTKSPAEPLIGLENKGWTPMDAHIPMTASECCDSMTGKEIETYKASSSNGFSMPSRYMEVTSAASFRSTSELVGSKRIVGPARGGES